MMRRLAIAAAALGLGAALIALIWAPLFLDAATYKAGGGGVADNSVTTAKIANNAVTGAKIAMGSDAAGDVLYYNGTDYVRLAAGTSSQLLHSGVTPSWSSVATGDIAANAVDGTKIAMGSDATGDVLVYNGTDYARLAVGAQGYVLRVNPSGTVEWGPSIQMRRFLVMRDDFLAAPTQTDMGWGSTVSGTAASVSMSTTLVDANTPGVVNCNAGTDTNSRCSLSISTNQFTFSTAVANEMNFETRVQVAVLSDGTNTYQTSIGFGDTAASTVDPTDGIYFVYSSAINSGKWRCTAAAAGVETDADDTGTAVAATTWYRLRATLNSGTLQCFVDDVQIGSNITTNIPTGANTMGLMIKIHKTAGTGNNPTLSTDYFYFAKAISR